MLRRLLALNGHPHAGMYAWKAVRAGRATELSRTPGVSLADIMRLGEWKSDAVFSYIRPADADPETAIQQALDASDAEEEDDDEVVD